MLNDDSAFGQQWAVISATRRILTTNNTQIAIYTYDVFLASSAIDIVAAVIGKSQDNGDIYRVDLRAAYSRNGSAAPVLQGAIVPTNEVKPGTMSAASATIGTSGNNVLVLVTGNAAAVDWTVAVQLQQIGVIV
jgi:hypothetical protein